MKIVYSEDNRPTLQSVANAAGVSVSTVSLVLNGKDLDRRISPETSERVKRIAEEFNYAPNLLTRSLRKGRTRIVSLFSSFRHREWGDLYMDRVSSAVETACGEMGYDVLIQCNFARTVKQTFEFLNGGIAEGVLMFAPEADDPLVAILRKSRTPVVILNGHDPLGQYSSVGDDVYSGMQQIANEICAQGHKNVLTLSAKGEDVRDAELRVGLLETYLERNGVTLKTVCWGINDESTQSIFESIQCLENPVTAVFCWHDRLAYKFLEVCEEYKLSIPNDLSVFGYDSIHWPSTTQHVVSSVDVDIRAIAQAGLRLLDETISNPRHPVSHEMIPVQYVPGTSSHSSSFAKVQS